MKEYDHKKIEIKWQKEWEKKKLYEVNPSTDSGPLRRKFYSLIEFPYPSGAGMHVGHIRSNTAMDIISRKRRMEGYNVLYPIGWDAFGLPTENYAIKSGIPPAKVTKQNTDTFRRQLKALGFSFDWSREINTTDPAYYKWTQWIFLQMFKKGLAYKKKTEINWCTSCKIGLANEEVVGGVCERCGGPVVKKEKEQWMLAITKYADRLDRDLDDVDYLEKIKIQQRNWIGREVDENGNVTYNLRDWIFSRQRYWGEPIPLVYCQNCAKKNGGDGWVAVLEKDLPVVLPKVKSYQPTDNGESPLANIKSFVNTKCPKCKGPAKRETDTMPNWAGSSWYFLRYTDPKNKKEFASKKNLKYWTGVDWYNGGMEHTTLHLLYSRFWHKFLYDIKMVPTHEPYMKRTSHGMILAEKGEKMSKSKGNTVNPDDIVKMYGADTLRMYEMFMGPFDQAVSWSSDSIIGPRRFLERVWRLGIRIAEQKYQNLSRVGAPAERVKRADFDVSAKQENFVLFATLLHKTIKKVSEDIESMSFNTSISSMMILLNEFEKIVNSEEGVNKEDFKIFLQLLAPFAPHITEELWKEVEEKKSIHLSKWPKYDPKKIIEESLTIAVQVNGKVRDEIVVTVGEENSGIEEKAKNAPKIQHWILGKEIKKIIVVQNRLVNIVV